MKIEVFKELQPYSISELESKLGMGDVAVRELLRSLSLMNIVKRLSNNASKLELEDLFETDDLLEMNTFFEGEIFVFKFVGMLTVNDVCLIIYPKYMDSFLEDKANNYMKLKQLVAVIRKYEARKQSQNASMGYDSQYNSLAITLELIEDHLEHGLYSNNRQIIEENGFGEILWEKTINVSPVFFSNGIPLYLDLFTLNQESNEQDFFRQLHRIVISNACAKLRDVLEIIDVVPVVLTDTKVSALGGKEFILSRINQELAVQFVTRKQVLLNLIKSYILNEEGSQTDEKISFVGTNTFHLVWEDVCSVVFEDCLNSSIKELGLSFEDDTKHSTTLADVIEKPTWTHYRSGKSYKASKTLTPDIINIIDDNLSIYDAKYYRIKLDENGVANNPGVGDVTKQLFYGLMFKDFVKKNNLTFKNNGFLFPYEGDSCINIGSVKMETMQKFCGLSNIDVFLVSASNTFSLYLI